MPNPFPPIELKRESSDRNPAIQLFGRRLFVDQTVSELLHEFMLIASSGKRIVGDAGPFNTILPEIDRLRAWPRGCGLEYAPKFRLNLKLFSFLGASRLETRHPSHGQHYRELIKNMRSAAKLSMSGSLDADEILKTLENLFLGFQGVGGQRTWCAASFLPITKGLLADESIWKATSARDMVIETWNAALPYFSHNQQIFLARSGVHIYLQMCNALKQDGSVLQDWATNAGLSLSPRESNPAELRTALERGISSMLNACPETVGKLAEFIDTGVDDAETAKRTDYDVATNMPRFASCGWCPEESWPEGLLFAIEVLRLCEAAIDPIERIELLEIACAMQVMRTLCAQSARYVKHPLGGGEVGSGPLGFVWTISDPTGEQPVVKQISRRNLNAIQRMIHDAVRNPDILATLGQLGERELAGLYGDADRRYGHKLFVTIAKRIGLIVPRRGAGPRFVLNDKLLRFLVLSLLRPGERATYDTFKNLLMAHFGIAVDDERIALSCEWSGTSRLTTLGGHSDHWLIEMLDASGFLIRLSDSCSLVMNPFDGGEEVP